MNPFRGAKRLGRFLGNIKTLSPDTWLYLPEGVEEVTASTLCLPISLDREGPKDVEWLVKGNDLEEFLSAADLEEVIENLRQQKGTFTESELIAAVNHYWKNDDFINVSVYLSLTFMLPARR